MSAVRACGALWFQVYLGEVDLLANALHLGSVVEATVEVAHEVTQLDCRQVRDTLWEAREWETKRGESAQESTLARSSFSRILLVALSYSSRYGLSSSVPVSHSERRARG